MRHTQSPINHASCRHWMAGAVPPQIETLFYGCAGWSGRLWLCTGPISGRDRRSSRWRRGGDSGAEIAGRR